MKQPTSIILSSTYHDPQFRLKSLLVTALPTIKELFSQVIIFLTPLTNSTASAFLTNEGFQVIISESMKQVEIYKKSIKIAIDYVENPQIQRIFYIDFDRLIHWINSYPDELKNIVENNSDVHYLHIARTSRAFETHPSTQKETEKIINALSSKTLGFKETIDVISVCFLFTKELGERILEFNNPTKTGFYGIWPIIFWKFATKNRYIEVEGLEWETPDRFQPEISKVGYDEWLKKFQSPEEWKKRVQFIQDTIEELSLLVDFQFNLRE